MDWTYEADHDDNFLLVLPFRTVSIYDVAGSD
jgi:hypothetical protein